MPKPLRKPVSPLSSPPSKQVSPMSSFRSSCNKREGRLLEWRISSLQKCVKDLQNLQLQLQTNTNIIFCESMFALNIKYLLSKRVTLHKTTAAATTTTTATAATGTTPLARLTVSTLGCLSWSSGHSSQKSSHRGHTTEPEKQGGHSSKKVTSNQSAN